MVTSEPGWSIIPFPISKPSSAVVKLATFGLPKRKYTGPSKSATAIVAAFV